MKLENSIQTRSRSHPVFLSMASNSLKSATTKKVMKSTVFAKSMKKSGDKEERTEEEKQKLKAIARRKKYSTIARPRDWKRKGHAYRISAALP